MFSKSKMDQFSFDFQMFILILQLPSCTQSAPTIQDSAPDNVMPKSAVSKLRMSPPANSMCNAALLYVTL